MSTPISHLHAEVVELYEQIGSYLGTANALHARYPHLAKPNQLRMYIKTELAGPQIDYETVEANVSLAKANQALVDRNRIKDKAFREYARVENAITSYNEALVGELKIIGQSLAGCEVRTGPLDPEAAAMVIHISDNHFNELVDLPHNQFDFHVAAQRLQLLAQKAKTFGQAYGVQRCVIFFGGDLMNSDRRLDELLSMSTNRAKATLLAVHIFKQFIADLRADFFIDCFGVTGNESRAKDELGWADMVATDSYDYTIYNMLYLIFEEIEDPGLRFHPMEANEVIFKLHNETFLGVHGHQVNASDQKKCQAIVGKFASRGINISHILCGHIHSALVSDFVSRNSSLVGSNAYSDNGLNFSSKASQNIHLVTKNGLDGIKCDLQNVDGVEGYEVVSKLAAYNAKSANKASATLRDSEIVIKVVI